MGAAVPTLAVLPIPSPAGTAASPVFIRNTAMPLLEAVRRAPVAMTGRAAPCRHLAVHDGRCCRSTLCARICRSIKALLVLTALILERHDGPDSDRSSSG